MSLTKFMLGWFAICLVALLFLFFVIPATPQQGVVIPPTGRFDVSVHYEDATLKVYTILDTVYCKNYIATTAGGLELLEVNKPCLNRKQKRNQ